MKFAVIGDIHSNKYALESVLEDIKERNILHNRRRNGLSHS